MIQTKPTSTTRRAPAPRRTPSASSRARSGRAAAHPPRPRHDPARFAEAVAALYEKLHRRALALTRDPDRAADLTQETVARALRFADRFEPGTNLHAWLQTMLGNLWLSEFRRGKFTAAAPDYTAIDPDAEDFFSRVPAPAEQTPEAAANRSEIRNSVCRALVKLPQTYRWPLRMFLEEGRSYEQIANDLSIPIGTVMSRIFRARKLLQADLLKTLPGHLPVNVSI